MSHHGIASRHQLFGQNHGHLSRRRRSTAQEYRSDPPAWSGRLCRHAQGMRPHRALPGRAGGDRGARRHHRGDRPLHLRLRHGQWRDPRHAQLSRLHQILLHLDQPRRLPRHPRRQAAQGRRHRQHRRDLHPRRLAWRFQPHVSGRPDQAGRRAAARGDARMPDARHRGGEARRAHRRHRRGDPDLCRSRALLGGARLLRPWRRPAVPRRAQHPALRQPERRRGDAAKA